jgi:hypothetical protein
VSRVLTRHTYGNRVNQIVHLSTMGIPISVALDVVTIRNSTVPYQGSGDHKDIRIYHSLDDPYGDGHKEGICHINIGSLVITLVIDDQMDLLRESTYTIWDLYGVLPVYSGQITTGDYAYDTNPDLLGKKRLLNEGTSSEGSRPRTRSAPPDREHRTKEGDT